MTLTHDTAAQQKNQIRSLRSHDWQIATRFASDLFLAFGVRMKLDPPLLNLVARCQTVCVAECCGIGAYDFSPIHVASYLTMYRAQIDASEVRVLRGQLEALKANYGTQAAGGNGATIDEMNAVFTPAMIDTFADELLANLDVATKLVEVSEAQRSRKSMKISGAATK